MRRIHRCLIGGVWCGVVLALSGCAHYAYRPSGRVPASPPARVRQMYEAPRELPVAEFKQVSLNSDYVVLRARLCVPVVNSFYADGSRELKDLWVEFSLPIGCRNMPIILQLPISGHQYISERFGRNEFVRKKSWYDRYKDQYATALILHGDPDKNKNKDKAKKVKKVGSEKEEYVQAKLLERTDPEDIDDYLEQWISDCIHVLDFIQSRPEFNPDEIFLYGLSQGGINGMTLVAIDPRIRAAFLGLAGEDVPYIITHSKEDSIVKKRREYVRSLRRFGMTMRRYEHELREEIFWEPKTVAACVDPQKVFLLLARNDDIVSYTKGMELKRHAGDPETEKILSGHYTAIIYLFHIRARAIEFFHRKLMEIRSREDVTSSP